MGHLLRNKCKSLDLDMQMNYPLGTVLHMVVMGIFKIMPNKNGER